MKWYLNMKIGKKLVSAFVLTALISGGMGLFALSSVNKLAASDEQLYAKMTLPIATMGELSTEFQRIRVNVRDMITAQSPEDIQAQIDKINDRKASIEEKAQTFSKTITSDVVQEDYDTLMASNTAFYAELDKVIALAKANNDAAAQAAIAEEGAAGVTSRAVQDAVAKMITDKEARAEEIHQQNADLASATAKITMILALIVFLISVFLGVVISRIIAKPLNKALYMMNEMSMGHFGERLQLGTKDEVGQMAQAMDYFADELQTKIIGVMNMISNGDVSVEIEIKDSKDEIAPALKKTVETIRTINSEIQSLIQSAINGKLDKRGDSSGYEGSWKEMIIGFNDTLDAIIGPLNVAAEYVDRIGKGEIPDRITDEYKGDFNELKNNLNSCIDAVNALVADSVMLSNAAIEGRLTTRAEAEKHGGDFAKIIGGVNQTLDTLVGFIDEMPAPVMIVSKDFSIQYMNRFGASLTGKSQAELIGNKCHSTFKTSHCNTESCACSKAMKQDTKVTEETDCQVNGLNLEISYTGIPIKDRSNNIIGALELITDQTAIVTSMRKAEKQAKYQDASVDHLILNLEKLAQGDLNMDTVIKETDEDTEQIGKNFEKINTNLNTSVQAIRQLVNDANMISNEAIEGRLETRADITLHSGEYAKIIEGLNHTLDAVAAPISEVTSVMETMSQGILSNSITGEYQGEFKVLADSVNSTVHSLRVIVGEISDIIGQIASGNLALEHVREYRGDYVDISSSLNTIIESLNSVLTEINNSADQVTIGAKQVSDGSQALSQGATEQASSLQELNASVTEIAAMTKDNAASANRANDLTMTVKNSAEEGSRHMTDMLKAMEDINESSNDISKIIKVIDDIAFQTNILALNAAVEAARAGQHGKGFAVVAEEVRNLAARSAAAAKDTTELIQGSIQKSTAGTGIANSTAAALSEIVGGVTQTAEIISEIARSSNEQAMGITQINTGLNQVSQVVQNNAATAEESAASSEELSSQSEILKGMVDRFKLRDAAGGSDILRLTSGGNVNPAPESGKSSKSTKIMLDFDEFDKY